MIPMFGPENIRPHLRIENLIPSAQTAFRAISDGTAQAPVYVLHPSDLADIHVKSATLPNCPIFTVKMAGWSQVLVDRGEPASSGMIVVFDSQTCKPLAILQDDHLISDYRTAAAGALVAKLLAPTDASSALIVGTGVQAKLQAEALILVRPIRQLKIWGRSARKVSAMVEDLRHAFPTVEINQRWSCFFDQSAAFLRWIRVSYQAAILTGSVWLAWTSLGVKMPWVEWGLSAL